MLIMVTRCLLRYCIDQTSNVSVFPPTETGAFQ